MTQEHKGEILALKNRVLSVDKDTVFLAHYDLNANDVLRGISPIGYKHSLNFDGVNDYFQTSLVGTFPTLTFEFWGFFDDPAINTKSRDESAFGDWTTTAGSDIHFGTRWSVGMHWNVNNQWVEIPATNLVYGWNHYALVYDTISNVKLVYINGILSSTEVASGSIIINDFKIGVATALNNYYRGRMCDFRIWNVVRSQAQIKAYKNINLHGDENGLLVNWKLNEGFGEIAYDSTIYGNDKSIIGGATYVEGNVIATLRNDGRFGKGIAVEEATNNLITDPLFKNGLTSPWGSWDGAVITFREVDFYGQPVKALVHTKRTNGALNAVHQAIGGLTAGSTYTLSFYAKIDPASSVSSGYINAYINAYAGFAINNKEWTLIQLTQTTAATGETIHITQTDVSFDVLIAFPQFEAKPFGTSFVNGSRDVGKLMYDNSIIQMAVEGTVSFWYKPTYLNTGYQIIMRTGNWRSGADGEGWGIVKQANNNQVYFEYGKPGVGPTYSAVTVGNVLGVNVWHFIVATWSATTLNLYIFNETGLVEKVTVGSSNLPLNYSAPISLGRESKDSVNIGNAIFDELRLDSIARTDEEITSWYYSNSPFWPKGIYKTSN